ncbi:hypothetical protein [Isoptericola nanjingensis]|uniref:hypothetical protein n=1 Tax=Isoptericola nanjingensis TaxID=903413 RepID=UPI003D18FF01
MPDYERPVTSAEEAGEHLRALAHATRWFDNPGDTYWVTADLLAITRRLGSVLVHVASAHLCHREQAHTDDGNVVEGAEHAYDAAILLRRASLQLDRVQALVTEAQSHSGRIAWYEPAAQAPGADETARPAPPPTERRKVVDLPTKHARDARRGITL